MDDESLLALIRRIAAGDASTAIASLRAHPEVATASLERGANREELTEFLLPGDRPPRVRR